MEMITDGMGLGRGRSRGRSPKEENINSKTIVRTLTSSDTEQVKVLDELSENKVCDMLDEDGGYAWGIFKNDRLLGYCTIGGVEGTEHQQLVDEANEVSVVKTVAKTLSDVYMHPYCRRFGLGTQMIEEAMENEMYNDVNTFYCTIHDYNLYEFYEKLGFHELEDGILVYDK